VKPVPLYHVWEYTDVDRAFWAEHLEDWVPRRIVDAHVHLARASDRIEPMTEAKRRQYWVNEVSNPIDADTAARCQELVFPGREVTCVAMGPPNLDFDLEASNAYVSEACAARGWHALALLRPQWPAERLAAELARPAVIGVKPYYALISPARDTRDKHLAAGIFEFLPHHALEVLDDRRAWITLHVPRAERLGHPDNLREVREICRRYRRLVLVVAHLGRSYTLPHAREGLPPLAQEANLVFDLSAVLNPDVLALALELFGAGRLLYGTDNPVFYMRGRRQWRGRTYVNRTSYPFGFNTEREPPEVEATYTLMMYEHLRAIRRACEDAGLGRGEIEAIFHGNAERLIGSVLEARGEWPPAP